MYVYVLLPAAEWTVLTGGKSGTVMDSLSLTKGK